ncbi:MAG: hypothetical protein J7L23_04255 [Candidatus Diapherotrites archaeon]|nr:hypothetical protein [Candidatus Diapherotrites archaeon]
MVERPAKIDRKQYVIIALIFIIINIIISSVGFFYIFKQPINSPEDPYSFGHYNAIPFDVVIGTILIPIGGVFGSIAVFIYMKKLKVKPNMQQASTRESTSE